MTIPVERSRAVLWAGGLLVALNADRRVPMKHRRAATAIARHFPTVEQVGLASLGGVLAKDGLFEHPRDCGNWLEHCPGKPLTYSTRLPWPSEDVDDRIDGLLNELPIEDFDEVTMDDLADHAACVDHARKVYVQHAARMGRLIDRLRPLISDKIRALGWEPETAADWLLRIQFDDDTKSAVQLLFEGRETDVLHLLNEC